MTDEDVTRFQNAVLVFSQCISALAEIESMKAANRERQEQGKADAYDEGAFLEINERFCLGWNSVVSILKGT